MTYSDLLHDVDLMLGDGLPFTFIEDYINDLMEPEEHKDALYLRAASVDNPAMSRQLGVELGPLNLRRKRRLSERRRNLAPAT